MATGDRRWWWILVAAALLGLAELGVLGVLLCLPAAPESLPDPGLAKPPPAHAAAQQAPEVTAQVLGQGMKALDAILARRVELAAEERGLDPAQLLPSAERRAAALEAGDPQSEAGVALVEAYRSVFEELGIVLE